MVTNEVNSVMLLRHDGVQQLGRSVFPSLVPVCASVSSPFSRASTYSVTDSDIEISIVASRVLKLSDAEPLVRLAL
jgi:hypothetical protein